MISYSTAKPFLKLLTPEAAHRAAILGLKLGLAGRNDAPDDPVLATTVLGLHFPNPVGVAAGFDKGAEVPDAMLALGFGFSEAGTVTPKPQPGNPKPRLFRLDEDQGVINRLGFNSGGLAPYLERVKARKANLEKRGGAKGIFGANVGKNRDTVDGAADYAIGIEAVCNYADYLVCNISSPNTPGLRNLQGREQLKDLLTRVLAARAKGMAPGNKLPPLFAKVGPDLDAIAIQDIAEVALETKVDGLVIGNTTIDRPATLKSPEAPEAGGLSGKPLTEKARWCLGEMYKAVGGRIPIVGCGGIMNGDDAYLSIRAGASLLQVYSALVFHGPELVVSIKRDLARRLRADGFTSVAAAVGADHR
ncbi:MAG TPA: quinone-dependent dihydroorotate dehydrogenase [Alphaproteobacteria bacterium]|jgi:dihydroorotate dehydrogenase